MKYATFIACSLLPMALLAGCSGSSSSPPPPDFGPIGTGLGAIGMGIVIAAVILSVFCGGKGDS